ncbi:MAG: 1-deoxy-D-xylulose-5-phosphate synthase [Clostridiales bacterium]|nr:1-deoxy-D-xylulose-5-phosphate synthase [Clostridiales bacterium]
MTLRLEDLKLPEDLRRLTDQELQELAGEVRRIMIETTSKNGGHLGAGLGVVELTLALHAEFESPRDKIVWDVGHQAYPHKLVTGRLHQFHTLRQPGGISGFLRRKESPHDVWEAGHASTGVSGALGYAKARDLKGEDYRVVAVVGDGALTGGLAYEGLNNAGSLGTDLIVILNDNSFSIAPNVGAIHLYLSRIRSMKTYRELRDQFTEKVSHIPHIGPAMVRTLERMKDSLKYFLIPGMWFEEMGFTYLGPVDGHHIPSLRTALRQAKNIRGPVLVHVKTVKGKGFPMTERAPDGGHSVKPFPLTGEKVPEKGEAPPDWTKVFSQELVALGKERPDLVAITAAMPDGTGTAAFKEAFPDRFFDVGIAELHAVVFAAGLALGGLRPVVAIYSTFLQRAYDGLIHDVGRMNLPVTFAIDRAGLVGADGDSHQGMWDIAYLRNIPNFVVMQPRDRYELRDMMRLAVEHPGPIAFRYPRGAAEEGTPRPPRPIRVGEGELLRKGRHVTLIGLGPLVYRCLEAADLLEREGISAAVIDARFAKPLDEALILRWAEATRAVVTVEDGVRAGGFGSAVLELLSSRQLFHVAHRILGYPDAYIPHGHPDEQRREMGLDAEGIARAAKELLAAAEGARRAYGLRIP